MLSLGIESIRCIGPAEINAVGFSLFEEVIRIGVEFEIQELIAGEVCTRSERSGVPQNNFRRWKSGERIGVGSVGPITHVEEIGRWLPFKNRHGPNSAAIHSLN